MNSSCYGYRSRRATVDRDVARAREHLKVRGAAHAEMSFERTHYTGLCQ